ncbi:hypothetical protein FQN60_006638 [Etheostoma spectabile]|uniref:Uncharacterized protein n=1 Tax=Etheostoma spectabile TaxID=54343 RepID=A0A5J5CES6_9PERO|nr:hypothetical protein FQN60_006638 [Etheostoma spectabile]
MEEGCQWRLVQKCPFPGPAWPDREWAQGGVGGESSPPDSACKESQGYWDLSSWSWVDLPLGDLCDVTGVQDAAGREDDEGGGVRRSSDLAEEDVAGVPGDVGRVGERSGTGRGVTDCFLSFLSSGVDEKRTLKVIPPSSSSSSSLPRSAAPFSWTPLCSSSSSSSSISDKRKVLKTLELKESSDRLEKDERTLPIGEL